MHASDAIRRGGYAALAGGSLFLVSDAWTLVQEFVIGSPEKFSEEAATTSWMFFSATFLAGAILLLIGLVALYARQSEESGILGLAGFLLAFIWMGLVVGAMWTFVFVAPSAAIEAPAFLDNESPAGR